MTKSPWHSFFFSAGFRPFFLLTAAHASLTALVWAGWLGLSAGGYELPLLSAPPPTLWHGHEMLFGFLSAAVAGFLLTAVPNWTGTPPVQGRPLMLLVGAWLLGRLAFWTSGMLPEWLVIVADLAFWPLLIGVIARALLKAPTPRNAPFVVLLSILALASLGDHLGLIGVLDDGGTTARHLAIDCAVLMMVIIGGRITPTFSRNWLVARGENAPKPAPARLDLVVIACVAVVAVLDLLCGILGITEGPLAALRAVLTGLSGLLVAYRLWCWQPWRVAAEPLLWVLHLGAAWIALGFALRAWALGFPLLRVDLGLIDETTALHMHLAGAAGTLILGVMGRASRGHSGLSLKASPLMAASYTLVGLSALIRVFGPLLFPQSYLTVVASAGALFSLAFMLFIYDFSPILSVQSSRSPQP